MPKFFSPMQYMKFDTRNFYNWNVCCICCTENQSRPHEQLHCFPQWCEMEKYRLPEGYYWSHSISGWVHKLQKWSSHHLPGAKPVTSVTSVGGPALLRDTLSPDTWFRDVPVPCVLLPTAGPAGQARLSSHLVGSSPLPSSHPGFTRERSFHWSDVHQSSPEMNYPSQEGFPDPTLQQRKPGFCREQTWGSQHQFTYTIQLSTVITDMVCSMLIYLLLYITHCAIACRNSFGP